VFVIPVVTAPVLPTTYIVAVSVITLSPIIPLVSVISPTPCKSIVSAFLCEVPFLVADVAFVRSPVFSFPLSSSELYLKLFSLEVLAFEIFLGFSGRLDVFVLNEAVGVATPLLSFHHYFLDFSKGLEKSSQLTIEFLLGEFGVDVGNEELGAWG